MANAADVLWRILRRIALTAAALVVTLLVIQLWAARVVVRGVAARA